MSKLDELWKLQQLYGLYLFSFSWIVTEGVCFVHIYYSEQVMALDAQNIVAVSCGEAHTLALNDKGQVFAWGQASDGQLGLAITEDCMRVPR